jgi:hypothetical protein
MFTFKRNALDIEEISSIKKILKAFVFKKDIQNNFIKLYSHAIKQKKQLYNKLLFVFIYFAGKSGTHAPAGARGYAL